MQTVACVVGASGFLGREVASSLVRSGDSCTDLSLRPQEIDEASVAYVAEHLLDGKVKVVINCAAARFNGSLRSPHELLQQANVFLPVILAQACARTKVPLLHIGSRWQLGEHGEGPNGPYAQSKEEGEREAREILHASDIPFLSILIRDTYGMFDPRRTLINDLLEAAMSRCELPLTDGHQRIDPLHVTRVADVVVSCGRALATGSAGGRYEIGSTEPPTVRELVGLFEQSWGTALAKQWGAMPPRGVELFDMEPVLPWAPRWSPAGVLEDFSAFVAEARGDYTPENAKR